MRARVPLDVDLEDRVVFGLTAPRFGYVTLAALAALAAWHTLPLVGGPAAALMLAVGCALGWGRWRGRGVDHWILAVTLWTIRTRRLELGRLRTPDVRGALARARRDRRSAPAVRESPATRFLRRPPPVRRLRVVSGDEGDP